MTSGRIASALLRSSLFYRRPIHALVPTCSLHHFAAGQPIFEPGEAATHLVVLDIGEADTYAIRVNGDVSPVAFHRAPDALIEPGIFASDRRRRIGAIATADTETVFVPRDALIRAGAADPVLAERLLTAIADVSAAPAPAAPPRSRTGCSPACASWPRRSACTSRTDRCSSACGSRSPSSAPSSVPPAARSDEPSRRSRARTRSSASAITSC